MKPSSAWLALCLALSVPAALVAAKPEPVASGLVNPESVAVGADGRVYVSVIGEFDKDGDGAVVVIDQGKPAPFCQGLNDPKGLALLQKTKTLVVADKDRVLKIDDKGKSTVFAGPDAFPAKPRFLNDVLVDPESDTVYVSDSGDTMKGTDGVVYKIDPKGKVSVVTDAKNIPGLKTPNGLLLDGQSHLLLLDFGSGELHRVKVGTGAAEKVADGFKGGDGLAWDRWGRLYISSWEQGKVWVIGRPGDKPVLVAEGLKSAADLCLDPTNKLLLVPDMKAGSLVSLPAQVPGAEVDDSKLNLKVVPAFANVKWANWDPEPASGKVVPQRPIVLTHAGDGSNRVFVATQQGVVHVLDNDDKPQQSKVFLDISQRVRYDDKTNEEGFLGMAFPPDYKTKGEFYVFYTDKNAKYENVVSRFKVSKDDPNVADPSSEQELLRVKHKFWNHDGGTIVFGTDGMLYIVLGDGGFGGDPDKNGQNLGTLLGKILRIDVNAKGDKTPYAIPKDNPFVGKEGARGEIWAYGLRNPWRIAFDKKTGALWCGEVGQNLYEEINLITKGGNYGWSKRESLHPFGADGVAENKEMIDPIWEYHHDIGKSITGGGVYRGTKTPELEGHYLYADYVSGRVWALKYDEAKKRVVANRPLLEGGQPIISFGEDEKGEMYFLTVTPTGKGIFRFAK